MARKGLGLLRQPEDLRSAPSARGQAPRSGSETRRSEGRARGRRRREVISPFPFAKPAHARAFLWGLWPPPVSQPRHCGARARDHLRFGSTRPLYAGHAAVSRDQGPLPEHARPLSHGGLLRDLLRGRRSRQPPDRHHAHEARQGPRRQPHPDGGRPLHDARPVHRASRAPRRIGRGGRAAGHARQGDARAQDFAHRDAGNPHRHGAAPAKERLDSPFGRPARAARPALGLCVADAQ